jgi:hypothetical protein
MKFVVPKKAFAVSLDNSEDQTLVVNILSGTQFAYTSTNAYRFFVLLGESPPINIRSGCNKSSTAVPSAKTLDLTKFEIARHCPYYLECF